MSDPAIAEMVGVNQSTVFRIRGEEIQTDEVVQSITMPDMRIGRDGVSQPATKQVKQVDCKPLAVIQSQIKNTMPGKASIVYDSQCPAMAFNDAIFLTLALNNTAECFLKVDNNVFYDMNKDSISPVQPATGMELLTDVAAAAFLGVKPSTLRCWRKKKGVPAVVFSRKVIRYRMADLVKWVSEHRMIL